MAVLNALAWAVASWVGNRGLRREIARREQLPREQWLWHNYYGWGQEYDPSLPYPPR